MSYTLVNRPSVAGDILHAVDYYKSVSPELPKQFLFRLHEATDFIGKFPLAFQMKYKNVRTLLLRQFPYHIHYLIDEDRKQIVVLAIIHAYKNPQDYPNT